MERDKVVPFKEAEKEVAITSRRIGLLHLAYAETLVSQLGDEQGKKLILKAIKNYGEKIGKEMKEAVMDQGFQPIPGNYGIGKARGLPKFGMHEKMEEVEVKREKRKRFYGCEIGKVFAKYGEQKLGRFYCYVDPVKYMAFNPEFKLIHTKCLPDGDEYCEFAVRKTTEKERKDFSGEEKDWRYIDQ